jgi:glutamyl-tRNA reductase
MKISQRELKKYQNVKKILNNKLKEFIEVEKERKLERAMSEVPTTIKNITSKAYTEVFAKDLEGLDNESRDVLDKFVTYLEKKYISVPMKMAKEILLKQNAK